MDDFNFVISGISNPNRIVPQGGCWYYSYLASGNIRIHGRPSDAASFCPKKFEKKVIANGGSIQMKNKLLNVKQNKMEKNDNKNLEASLQELSSDDQIATTSLETLENEVNELATIISNTEVITTNTGIVLESKSLIKAGNTSFAVDLGKYLQNKTIWRIPEQVKQILNKIGENLTSGEILASNYTSSTCLPLFVNASGSNGISKITINADAYISGNLEVIIASKVKLPTPNDAICSIKQNYPLGVHTYSSNDIIKALSQFSAGRAFLNGLVSSTETFTSGQ